MRFCLFCSSLSTIPLDMPAVVFQLTDTSSYGKVCVKCRSLSGKEKRGKETEAGLGN